VVDTALPDGTTNPLVRALELVSANAPDPNIPKLAALETLRKFRLDQSRVSLFTARSLPGLQRKLEVFFLRMNPSSSRIYIIYGI
jgi:hypothetical protein